MVRYLVYLFIIAISSLEGVEIDAHLLITGCGRSGTTFITEFLKKNHLDVRHEALGMHGAVSWGMAVDDDVAHHGPGSNGIHFHHVFHQVRNPIHVIPSVETFNQTSWAFIYKHIPEIDPQESLVVRAAKYWVYWNLKAEEKAHWRYQIETIGEAVSEMSKRLGYDLDPTILTDIPTYTNGRLHRKLSWDILREEIGDQLFEQVRSQAIRYGYSVD